jgi:SAM-dependent methyltransferase
VDQPPVLMRSKRCRFCGWAPEYERDKLSRILGGYQQQAVDFLRPRRDDILLDAGCGTGAAVRRAADTVEVAVGVDACPRMIGRAHELGADVRRAAFVIATAERLPFTDGLFTALLCTSVMRHVSDRTAVVREIARVLAPGGRVVLGDFVPELAFTGRRATRRHAHQVARASLAHADLRPGPHLLSSSFLGPYLITHATKVSRGLPAPCRSRRRPQPGEWRSTMQIERSRLVEVLRQRGSEQTARAVEQQLSEHIDTQRDSMLIKRCGIDPNVLETIMAPYA